MRKWMWRVAAVFGGLVALVGVVYGVGSALPAEHVASTEAVVTASPEAVFDLIADPERGPEWRSDIDGVEMEGERRWRELGGEPLTMELRRSERPRRFEAAVVDHPDFGGTWTWELEPVDGGTRVRITEDGVVYNPIFRAVQAALGSQTWTMEARLDDLQGAFADGGQVGRGGG